MERELTFQEYSADSAHTYRLEVSLCKGVMTLYIIDNEHKTKTAVFSQQMYISDIEPINRLFKMALQEIDKFF